MTNSEFLSGVVISLCVVALIALRVTRKKQPAQKDVTRDVSFLIAQIWEGLGEDCTTTFPTAPDLILRIEGSKILLELREYTDEDPPWYRLSMGLTKTDWDLDCTYTAEKISKIELSDPDVRRSVIRVNERDQAYLVELIEHIHAQLPTKSN